MPRISDVEEGRVSQLRPLREDDFGLISTEKGVVVGRGEFLHISLINSLVHGLYLVIAIYAKAGGKNGKFSAVSESSSISAISSES